VIVAVAMMRNGGRKQASEVVEVQVGLEVLFPLHLTKGEPFGGEGKVEVP